MVLLLLFCIYFIKFVTQKYLAPSLFYIKKAYDLSLKITTLILIPLSSGIPDLMVAINSTHMEEGIYITLGTLFGSLLFVTTIIISVILLSEQNDTVYIKKGVLLNYIFTLVFLCVIIIVYGLIVFIKVWHAFLLLISFAVYFVIQLKCLDHNTI